MNVAIVNTGSGDIHVHSPSCKDLKATKYSRADVTVMDVDSRQHLVVELYDGFEELAEDGSNWSEFASNEGLRFFPCVTL